MKSIARFIITSYFESIGLTGINATLDENEKLDAIAVAFFGSAATDSVDNPNKEGNSVNADSYAAKGASLGTAEE